MITAIRRRLEQREEGFTLIELLIVVIIIGILAAIAIPTFLNQREGAFTAAATSDLRNAAIGVEQQYTSGNGYVAPPGGFRTSEDVTVAFAAPLPAGNGPYCLNANHASLPAAVDFHYAEDTGRPMPGPCA